MLMPTAGEDITLYIYLFVTYISVNVSSLVASQVVLVHSVLWDDSCLNEVCTERPGHNVRVNLLK